MCLNFLKLHSLCNEESIYIYEYMLTFSTKFWVCLGIQGHTPGAAPVIGNLRVRLRGEVEGFMSKTCMHHWMRIVRTECTACTIARKACLHASRRQVCDRTKVDESTRSNPSM